MFLPLVMVLESLSVEVAEFGTVTERSLLLFSPVSSSGTSVSCIDRGSTGQWNTVYLQIPHAADHQWVFTDTQIAYHLSFSILSFPSRKYRIYQRNESGKAWRSRHILPRVMMAQEHPSRLGKLWSPSNIYMISHSIMKCTCLKTRSTPPSS